MSDYPFHEPFGPEWVRPTGDPCPGCACCTKRLCETAAAAYVLDQNCAYHGERSLWDQLVTCPCARAGWTKAQRDGTACVHCGTPVNRTDPERFSLINMNGGLVAACKPACVVPRPRVRPEVSK